jgi:hypothetical protein
MTIVSFRSINLGFAVVVVVTTATLLFLFPNRRGAMIYVITAILSWKFTLRFHYSPESLALILDMLFTTTLFGSICELGPYEGEYIVLFLGATNSCITGWYQSMIILISVAVLVFGVSSFMLTSRSEDHSEVEVDFSNTINTLERIGAVIDAAARFFHPETVSGFKVSHFSKSFTSNQQPKPNNIFSQQELIVYLPAITATATSDSQKC